MRLNTALNRRNYYGGIAATVLACYTARQEQ